MGTKTPHYGFEALAQNDHLSDDDYQFTNADRYDMDTLLYALFNHHHNGESISSNTPTDPPGLLRSNTGGIIGAGLTVRYKYALVDVNGVESTASPEATVTTPGAIQPPLGPQVAVTATTGGTLLPGTYFYGLSAYVGSNTVETPVVYTTSITVASGSTNITTVTFPSTPSGASGFNIYRRAPGETTLSYLASAALGATPATDYVDDGTTAENCNRQPSLKNVTNSQNSITVSIPGATPAVPDGYTWKIYRTYQATNYTNSLLANVVTETSEGSGIITPTFLDTGLSTSAGAPRTTSLDIPGFSKIQIPDEVEGTLAPDHAFQSATMTQLGASGPGVVDLIWACPYDKMQLVDLWLTCDIAPTDTAVQVDLEYFNWGDESWDSIWADNTNAPTLQIGEQAGTPAQPSVGTDTVSFGGPFGGGQVGLFRMNVLTSDDSATYTTLHIDMMTQNTTFEPFEFAA